MHPVVATVGGIPIEESCHHFYPRVPQDVEFKTLCQAKIWLLFDYFPRLRFLRQMDVCLFNNVMALHHLTS